MKKISITILCILFSMIGSAQNSMDLFTIQVDGLGCPFCAYGLEKKFKEFKGIKKVTIDIETGDFGFEYPAEKKLSMESVFKQVEKAGYTPIVAKITRADGTTENSEDDKLVLDKENLISDSFFVAGNCEMCRSRIEKAANRINGVDTASWDQETKLLTVSYDESYIALDKIKQSVANSGHDSKAHKAKDNLYKKLPKCCQYERLQ